MVVPALYVFEDDFKTPLCVWDAWLCNKFLSLLLVVYRLFLLLVSYKMKMQGNYIQSKSAIVCMKKIYENFHNM